MILPHPSHPGFAACFLIRRLECAALLSAEEKQALVTACAEPTHPAPNSDLIRQGEKPQHCHLLLDGCACAYKMQPDGRRQIVGLMLPGDVSNTHTPLLRRMDYSIGTLGSSTVVRLTKDVTDSLMRRFPRLDQAFRWAALVQESVAREWLVNIGQRTAFERMAHLFCELFERLRAVGLAGENSCTLPLTQAELGEILALSAVHVNRTLMEMKRTGLATFRSQRLVILDHSTLCEVAAFDSGYLHMEGMVRPLTFA